MMVNYAGGSERSKEKVKKALSATAYNRKMKPIREELRRLLTEYETLGITDKEFIDKTMDQLAKIEELQKEQDSGKSSESTA